MNKHSNQQGHENRIEAIYTSDEKLHSIAKRLVVILARQAALDEAAKCATLDEGGTQ